MEFCSWHWQLLFLSINGESTYSLLICPNNILQNNIIYRSVYCVMVQYIWRMLLCQRYMKSITSRCVVLLWCVIYRFFKVSMLVWHHQNISNYTECSECLRGCQLTGITYKWSYNCHKVPKRLTFPTSSSLFVIFHNQLLMMVIIKLQRCRWMRKMMKIHLKIILQDMKFNM